jgi:hypothetical protein
MTEVLFVLTVIYVAYVLYVIINDNKAIAKSITPTAEPEKQVSPVQDSSAEPIPEKEPPKTLKTAVPKTVKSTDIKKPVATKKGLKDPKTGDIATIYNNYRFTKRWIKDALVSEGLLEKVYKNNELNAEIEAAIKVAIAKLEAMKQYKV